MGIFRWIMSLLRRKKIAKHEYVPEKAIALKKVETIRGQIPCLSQQVPCKNDKSEISEQACIYPDSQIVLQETQQQKRRRRRQQIQSDTPPVNEQLFAAQNTQDSSDFYPEDEKTTSAANAEAKENQCAAADAEEISEIETGCSIKDMVAIDVCRSEKTEEHEPGQAADKTSAIDESPEADMMLIAQKEDSVSEETENTLAEEAAEAEKNDVQEHQAKIISVETKIDEPQGIEQTEESSADVIDPAEYQLEKEYTGDSENDEKEPVSPESVAEDVYSEVQEGRNFVLDTGGEVRTDYAIQEWKEDKWETQSENTEESCADILMHCFVCDHHIPKLFDFLYAYYELDLLRQIELSDVRKLRDVMVSGEY